MAHDVEELVIQLTAETRAFQREMRNAAGVFDKAGRDIERSQNRVIRNVNAGWKRMSNGILPGIAGIGAALSVRQIIAYADAWTTAGNKIKAAGTPVEDQHERLTQLADTAIRTRASLDGTVTLFARLERSTQGLGKSEAQLLRITETVNSKCGCGVCENANHGR